MSETIERRLAGLQAEYEKGQERLHELRQQENRLQETLLRIEGAMAVLQELLDRHLEQSDRSAEFASASAQNNALP